MSTSGFARAGFSKFLVFASCAATFLAAGTKSLRLFSLDSWAQIGSRLELWRLWTSQVPADSLAAGLAAWFLLYRFRAVERQMGTARYAGLGLAALVAGGAARAAALWALAPAAGAAAAGRARATAGGLACGPLEIIFAAFVLFHRCVPKLHPDYMRLGPLRLSDKSFAYFLGAQMLLSAGWGSALPAAAGLVVGAAVAAAAPGSALAAALTVPAPLARACQTVVAPWWESRAAAAPGAGGNGRRGGDDDAPAAPATRRAAGGVADPAAVARLVAMGFDEAAVRAALARAGGDENAAANVLLGM